jgi:prepilin-type N-terminal cleavage/methylation domain-containing protein/prepilin-type processing-associated H-X9-DG protein
LRYTNFVLLAKPNLPVGEIAHCGFRRFRLNSRVGFSLVELLITLALLLIISTMYFGFSSPNHQRTAKRSCEANLQKIFLAQEIYARDNAGAFPVVASAATSEVPLDLLVPRYSVDREIFICPGSKDSPLPAGESLRTNKISYAYYMGRHSGGAPSALMSDAQVNTNSKSAGDAIFSATGKAPGNNHHQFGGNILFNDGHVESSPTNLVSALPANAGVVLLNPKR